MPTSLSAYLQQYIVVCEHKNKMQSIIMIPCIKRRDDGDPYLNQTAVKTSVEGTLIATYIHVWNQNTIKKKVTRRYAYTPNSCLFCSLAFACLVLFLRGPYSKKSVTLQW